jgi:hypothetical protein
LTLNSRDELHTLEPVDKNLQAAVIAHQEADLTVGIGFLQSDFFLEPARSLWFSAPQLDPTTKGFRV